MNSFKIYLVEDDEVIANSLKKFLESWGYEVATVDDFEKVFDEFMDFSPDLLLMDVSLPYFNGYYWTEMIRRESSVPIIFISSASENLNKIMAMNMGADDYITKPFDLDFLEAKIKAMIRRSYEYTEASKNLTYKDVTLYRDKMTILFNNNEADLTKNEYMIIEMLLGSPERVFKRDEIMDRIWQSDEFIDDNTLTVNIMRLRKKLEDIGLTDFIKTKKKVGYYIER